jgi:hypothetical protein
VVSIDTFLLQPDRAKKLDFMHTLNLPWIVDALNARTREMMINEQHYLRDKTGDSIEGLKSFYSNRLPSYMNKLKAHEAVLDVGWGIGWGGMTGQLLDNADLEANHGALRSKLRLAPKYHGFPFPKSRRIAIENQTSLPMGWVKIHFKERDVMKPSRIDLRQEGIAMDM